MIAAWLGDLAAPLVAAAVGLAVLALLAAHRWDRPRVWMLPTLPSRPVVPPDVVADRFIAELIERQTAAHSEAGIEIRAWRTVGWTWVVEVNACVAACSSTDRIHEIVTEAVWAARSRS